MQFRRICHAVPLGLIPVERRSASSRVGTAWLFLTLCSFVALRAAPYPCNLDQEVEVLGSGRGLAEQPGVFPGLEELFGFLLNLPDPFP